MAIAFDSSSTGSSTGASSTTFSHTTSGTDRLLLVGVFCQDGDNVTGVTYNGVSMTQMHKRTNTSTYYIYGLEAPATGANDVVISRSTSTDELAGGAVSYIRANQSTTEDANAGADISAASSVSLDITTVAEDCWAFAFLRADNGNISAGTGEVIRDTFGVSSRLATLDTDGAVTPPGTEALNASFNANSNGSIIAVSFTESSDSTKDVTANGNAQIDTAQSKFGGASGLFDGTGDYLTVPDNSAWAFGTGKFTIDAWVRTPSSDSNLICGQYDDATNFWGFQANSSTNTLSFGSITSGTWDINVSISATINTDTWYHVAIVRDGTGSGDWYLYLDGVAGTKSLDNGAYTGTIFNSGGDLQVGDINSNYANPMDGWIDELRIVKGAAVWTSNFTPPSSAYDGDDASGTELLLHMDGTDASTTFTDDSNSVGSVFTPKLIIM